MPVEKRKSQRVVIKVSAKAAKDTEDNRLGYDTRILYTKDISTAGARIICRGQLVTGKRFILILSLPQPYEPVAALSEIRWFRDADGLPSPHLKEAGVRFVQIDAQDKSIIDRLIRTRGTTESVSMVPKMENTVEEPRSGIYV